ncbi:MAG TPA: hypothetical protein VN429_04160 [Methanospirillum sp.]|uniref:hypothetical protein n=1 Tax=Methanospirillum sp. TaxID=45200 RepID=UPI002BBF9A16|nr:hypothetical protein [Methanospirillum sp.]HWQ63588.1 hypothetical protein [Methanospirillum sp.]
MTPFTSWINWILPSPIISSPMFSLIPWDDPKGYLKVAIEHAVCFSNADRRVIVFGVSDKTLGRSKAIHRAKIQSRHIGMGNI